MHTLGIENLETGLLLQRVGGRFELSTWVSDPKACAPSPVPGWLSLWAWNRWGGLGCAENPNQQRSSASALPHQSSGQGCLQGASEERPQDKQASEWHFSSNKLGWSRFCSPFREEPFCSSQNIRNVFKYGTMSSDYLNCTTMRQTHFQASLHLI